MRKRGRRILYEMDQPIVQPQQSIKPPGIQ